MRLDAPGPPSKALLLAGAILTLGLLERAEAMNAYCVFKPSRELYSVDYGKWLESGVSKCTDGEIIVIPVIPDPKSIDVIPAEQLSAALCDFSKTIAVFPSSGPRLPAVTCVLSKGAR
jgi:hypothetical protein